VNIGETVRLVSRSVVRDLKRCVLRYAIQNLSWNPLQEANPKERPLSQGILRVPFHVPRSLRHNGFPRGAFAGWRQQHLSYKRRNSFLARL